jgi:poly(3-hydroxybutyrate) depolymerase
MLRVARLGCAATALLVAGAAAACSGGGSGYEVRSDVVSHEMTQDIMVFEPDGTGPWPVVFALHGINGAGEDLTELRPDWPEPVSSCSPRPIAVT